MANRPVDDSERFDLSWPEKPNPNAPCAYAAEFASFCEAAIARLDAERPGNLPEAFLHLKAQLFDRYCDFLTDTPKNHTNPAGKRKHRCIDAVFNDAAREVRRRWRSVPLPLKLVRPAKHQTAAKSWLEEIEEGRST